MQAEPSSRSRPHRGLVQGREPPTFQASARPRAADWTAESSLRPCERPTTRNSNLHLIASWGSSRSAPLFFYRFLLFLPTCRWSFTAALRDGDRLCLLGAGLRPRLRPCYSARAFGPACDDADAKKSSRAGIDRPLPALSVLLIS